MDRLKKDDYIHGGTQKDFYNENERVLSDCPLCNSRSFKVLDTDRGLSVVKCNDCQLIYTNPRALNAEENYFGDGSVYYSEARLIFNGKKRHHRDRNYEYEINKIKKFKAEGKLLDVGTNMGFFLRKAKEAGYDTEGVEPSPSLSQMAREQWNLKIHNCYLESADLPENSFDIITLIDVLEHVTNPKELLAKCRRLLKSDGILVIKVPNGDYNYFKMQLAKLTGKGSSMDIWDCCEHVVHYTKKTFKQMAEENGFKIKSFFIPLPIHSPIWAHLVGHYYQYPSPFILDWKRISIRNIFYYLGKIEKIIGGKIRFGPDLMFILNKSSI